MRRISIQRSSTSWLLLAVLLGAAAFRLHGLNWDQQVGAHPDERYVVDVASRLSFPHGLNPFDGASSYPYGHLPLYLLALAHLIVPGVDLLLLGRALSALFDLGTVALTYRLGRRVHDDRGGLLAAAIVGLATANVQQAHFYTPDAILTFLVIGALLYAVRYVQGGRGTDLWLAGGWAGLAIGTKATAGLLLIPLGAAHSLRSQGYRGALWGCGAAAILVFLVSNPFALLASPTFVENLSRQAAIVRGTVDAPYTRQYRGTLPYVYPILQQLRWGLGWLTGLAALAGVSVEAVGVVRHPSHAERRVLLAWLLPYFFFVGGLYAKFPRYLLPLLPVLAVYAALFVARLRRWRPCLGTVLSILLLSCLLLRCLALTSMYATPHPWVTASEWIYEHVEPGSTVAVEAWDHPLPLDATDYVVRKLPIFEEDTPGKWEAMARALAEADYLVVASRRGYASLTRWSARYPHTARYYHRLFNGRLGFRPTMCFGRYPRLGPLVAVDDPTAGLPFALPGACEPDARWPVHLGRLDESFVVYDHPQVILFRASR